MFDDADVEFAANVLTNGFLYNAGQECMAAARLIVHRDVETDFVNALSENIRRTTKMGDPTDADTTLGPLVSARHFASVRRWIDDLPDHAAIALGGGAPSILAISSNRPL